MSSSNQPQSKQLTTMFNSCINHLTDLTNPHHLRQLQATYDPRQAPETLKLQLLIKSQKSLISDAENSSRDSHSASESLYLWSREQPDPAIQDVGDRLAYLNYQIGDLDLQLSENLEKSRSDLKQIRNLENELIKLRDREKTLLAQINKIHPNDRLKKSETLDRLNVMTKEHHGIEARMREITNQLPITKRKLMKSSYHNQFQAYQELADKLSIISHFGQLLLHELDDDPSIEYTGKDRTANIKGQAVKSLAQYNGPSSSSKPMAIGSTGSLQPQPGSFELHRADTRMFGETHSHILTNVPIGVNTIESQVDGRTGTQQTSQAPGHPNASYYPGSNSRINVGKSEEPNKSVGPTQNASGSSHPPKLPDRPKPETGKKLSESHHHHHVQTHYPDEKETKQSLGSADPGSTSTHDSHLQTSNLEPSISAILDQPPAYSPSQSGNP